MTRHPLILLSLLSFGCVQIPAAEGTRPANTDMDAADARKDLDTPDLNTPDADMRADTDMSNDMTVDMADMPAPTPCEDQDNHFIGILNELGRCTPTGCMPGFADQDKDLNKDPTNGCECAQSAEEDLPGDGDDSNCDGVDGEVAKAIFVSPDGDNNNDGLTPQSPVKTLGKARDLAIANSTREYILIAQGSYTGVNLELRDGVSLYGSCDTVNWLCPPAPSTTTITGGANEQSSPTLLAQGLIKPTTIQGLTLIGPTHTGKLGRTAYTVRAINSKDLNFISCVIEGGTGADGMDGTNGTDAMPPMQASGATGGTSACGANGGDGGPGLNVCSDVNLPSRAGMMGLAGMSSMTIPGSGGEQGEDDCSNGALCDSGGDGKSGADGANGNHGSISTQSTPAQFTPEGLWQPQTTELGAAGEHASGGGGGGAGGASIDNNSGTPGAGGGGGAGGCGGTAATPGQSGGASIALIATNSKLLLNDMTIKLGKSGAGGKGGRGGQGSLGLMGANGARGSGSGGAVCVGVVPHGDGGKGGKGGDGGDGASGYGGCAGDVYGIVLDSNSSFTANSNLKATGGMLGDAGQGGDAPSNRSGAAAPNGCEGTLREDVLELQ